METFGKAFACAALAAALAGPAAAQTNPAVRTNRDITSLAGAWSGSHLEQRSDCRSTQNNGFHGTYSQYGIFVDPIGHTMTINETGVTGLTCTWNTQLRDDAGRTALSGTLSCSDGRTGTFEGQGYMANTTVASIRLSVRLNGSETCAIDALLVGGRL